MIGRRAELAALTAAVTAPDRGPVVLLGEEGIGKTTLLHAGARLAAARGFEVVRGLTDRLGTESRPVAMIVDDAHAADPAALAALTRARRPLILLLAAATGPVPPEPLGIAVREIPVPPLNEAEAAELMDAQPDSPVGWLRSHLLRACRGNPLGIVELARATGPSHQRIAGPQLRLPEPIRMIFADRLAKLPEPTCRVLLYAAAAGDEDRLHVILAAAGVHLADIAAAERAELVTIAGNRVTFRHPLARVACYLGTPLGRRRQAHRDLAARLTDEPSRRAWHLTSAKEGPDEALAMFLEASADLAAEGHRNVEAAGHLEHAAQLSPDPQRAVARLARAAHLATLAADAGWSRQLWNRAGALSADPDLRGRALIGGGFAGALAEPAGTVVPRIADLLRSGVRDRAVVVGLTAVATGDVLLSGREDLRTRLPAILADARITDADDELATAVRAAALAVAGQTGQLLTALREPTHGPAEEARLLTVALTAWLGDEPGPAVSACRRSLDLLRACAATGSRPYTYVLLLEALLETASWPEAAEISAEAAQVGVTGRLTTLRQAIAAQTASLRVRQGDLPAAREALAAGSTSSDSRLVRCLTSRAAGQLAAAEGDWDRATTHFLALFGADGAPLHFAWSYRVLAELAAAAAHADRRAGAMVVLDRLRQAGARTPWQTLLHGRAAALLGLGDDLTTERRLAAAAGPAAAAMPYDQAVAKVEYADWLRSRSRQPEARIELTAAVETFRRIGAAGQWAAAREQRRQLADVVPRAT